MAGIRAVRWDGAAGALIVLDQTRLPGECVSMSVADVDALVDAIARLAVRGAPALGVAGGYGVVIAMAQGLREGWSPQRLASEIGRIRGARPTAVNLAHGVDRACAALPLGLPAVLAAADRIAAEDEAANRALSRRGADWVLGRVPTRPVDVLTHCNAGALATSAWGTALGVVRELRARNVLGTVYVDETRPLLQGSRLTAWELESEGIDYALQADSAAASTILSGRVHVAVVGADRIARNGDVANKIGTLGVALACRDAGVPLLVAAPASTVDPATPDGGAIDVEQRPGDEVLTLAGVRCAPTGARAHNPAFDVTPHRLVDAIVTEHGVVAPDGADVVPTLCGA